MKKTLSRAQAGPYPLQVNQVKGDSLANDNILGAKEDCIMEEFTVSGIGEQFNYTVPQYSATVLRIEIE